MMCFFDLTVKAKEVDEKKDGLEQGSSNPDPEDGRKYQDFLARRLAGQKDRPPYFSPCSGTF